MFQTGSCTPATSRRCWGECPSSAASPSTKRWQWSVSFLYSTATTLLKFLIKHIQLKPLENKLNHRLNTTEFWMVMWFNYKFKIVLLCTLHKLKNSLKKPRYQTGTLYYLLKHPAARVVTKFFWKSCDRREKLKVMSVGKQDLMFCSSRGFTKKQYNLKAPLWERLSRWNIQKDWT